MGYGSNCAEREGTEGAHPGNVTDLAAVRRGMSFLVVNKSRMEMRHSMKARERKGGATQAVTEQCKSLNGDMMRENLHSPGTAQAAVMLYTNASTHSQSKYLKKKKTRKHSNTEVVFQGLRLCTFQPAAISQLIT